MKKYIFIIIVSVAWGAMPGCRKKPQKPEAVSNAEKIAFYEAQGCQYLFTADRGQSDSLVPVFFGRTPGGDIKCIITEMNAGASRNVSRLFNGQINNWVLPSFDINVAHMIDFFRLDEDGFMDYESRDWGSKSFYSEREATMRSYPNSNWIYNITMQTSRGELLKTGRLVYNFKHGYYKNLYSMDYTDGAYELKDSYIYYARVYEHRNKSYLLYTDPEIVDGWGSVNLYVKVRDKSGLVFEHKISTGKTIYQKSGPDGATEGKEMQIVDVKKGEPMFVFYKNVSQISVLESPGNNDLKDVQSNLPPAIWNFFFLNNHLYCHSSSGKPYLFRVENKISVEVKLDLEKIKGIFGNMQSIILVVENDEKGLDVVELKQ